MSSIFDKDPAPTATAEAVKATPTQDKKRGDFFAAVRARGILNHMLDGPAKSFEENNPGMLTRWEYCPPSGDNMLVVAREGMGFVIADWSQMGALTTSQQKAGPVKVGDLVLMYAPEDIVLAIEMQDARMAYEDFKLPQSTYEEHIRDIKVRLKDGSTIETKSVGEIRQHKEELSAPLPNHELDEGGE